MRRNSRHFTQIVLACGIRCHCDMSWRLRAGVGGCFSRCETYYYLAIALQMQKSPAFDLRIKSRFDDRNGRAAAGWLLCMRRDCDHSDVHLCSESTQAEALLTYQDDHALKKSDVLGQPVILMAVYSV